VAVKKLNDFEPAVHCYDLEKNQAGVRYVADENDWYFISHDSAIS
jgi:hypothetical protein